MTKPADWAFMRTSSLVIRHGSFAARGSFCGRSGGRRRRRLLGHGPVELLHRLAGLAGDAALVDLVGLLGLGGLGDLLELGLALALERAGLDVVGGEDLALFDRVGVGQFLLHVEGRDLGLGASAAGLAGPAA